MKQITRLIASDLSPSEVDPEWLGVDAVSSQSPDRQPPMARAMRWVTEISTSGFMLAIPTVAGWWLDGRWGSSPWCLIVGGLLGLVLSFLHILKITGALQSNPKQK